MDPSEATSPKGSGNAASPAVVASFAPTQTSSRTSTRSAVIIQQKSPLLVATPPQVTRALAYSHPFLLPLNTLAGLISWSTNDPWESFIFVCSFWATVLYGDLLILYAGPVLVIAGLMLGMYTRRFSPLSTYSSPVASSRDHRRTKSSSSISSEIDGQLIQHSKSLDDIVDTLNTLTLRCNTLLEPFLKLTDFLSTQHSATSATTRPALVQLLYRMVGVLPIWIVLSLSPVHLITARRVVFIVGTLIFTWHSKPARVCRTLLWRSLLIRHVSSLLTGFDFAGDFEMAWAETDSNGIPIPRTKSQNDIARKRLNSASTAKSEKVGVRFTFTIFENQRRWVGIGWTTTLFAYERAPWTDDHLNGSPDKDNFKLPHVEGAGAAWRWVEGSEWHVEEINTDGSSVKKKFAPSSVSLRGRGNHDENWIYYDNSWQGGRAQDGWGRYTRRRKWVRDAELVEVPTQEDAGKGGTASALPAIDEEVGGSRKKRGFFGRRLTGSSSTKKSSVSSKSESIKSNDDEEKDSKTARRLNEDGEDEKTLQREAWDVGDDVKMALG